jgi:hypothetical protein
MENPLSSLIAWVNFINVLRAAFQSADPKSAKSCKTFFALWGSAHAKAACRMLMILTPWGFQPHLEFFLIKLTYWLYKLAGPRIIQRLMRCIKSKGKNVKVKVSFVYVSILFVVNLDYSFFVQV